MTQREHWGTRLGFLAATAGSAIGLGSLWKFPYSTGANGGGLFVLAYVLFTFFIGIPLFTAELIMGRHSQRSPVGAFSSLSNYSQNWKMVGWLSVLVNFLILSYYSVVAGWAVNYTLMSLNHFTSNKTPEQIGRTFETMYASGGINIFWFFIFMLMTVGVVYGGVRKGIEYWSRLLMPILLTILIILMIYSMTLSGFPKALHFIFYPDYSKLTASGMLEALGLSFYTLSVGMGIILTYGSYMRKQEDIPKTALTIGIVDVMISLMASLMIFPIIFTFGFEPAEGPGLLFKVMPVLFEKLPATLILSTLFFMLVVFTALTSTISIFEVQVATFIELFNWSRRKAVLWLGLAVFVFGIPSALSGTKAMFPDWEAIYGKTFFTTVDYVCSNWILPINGILTAFFAGWLLDAKLKEAEFIEGSRLSYLFRPWAFLIKWVAPFAILLVILQKSGIIDLDA